MLVGLNVPGFPAGARDVSLCYVKVGLGRALGLGPEGWCGGGVWPARVRPRPAIVECHESLADQGAEGPVGSFYELSY